jgi:hypothetical protein
MTCGVGGFVRMNGRRSFANVDVEATGFINFAFWALFVFATRPHSVSCQHRRRIPRRHEVAVRINVESNKE